MTANTYDDRSRLLAKIVRGMVAQDHFDDLGDLTDALKYRLARLKIAWTPEDISGALAVVGSNLPLVQPESPDLRCAHKFIDRHFCVKCGWVPGPQSHSSITRDDAAEIVRMLKRRLGAART